MVDSRDELREQLEQINERQNLLLEITRRIAAGGSLGAMLPDILNIALKASYADGIRVLIDSPDGPLTYASGVAAGKMIRFDSLIARLVAEYGLLAVPDLTDQNGQFQAQLEPLQELIGGVVALPLEAQSVLQGVMWMAYDNPGQFTADDTMLLSILSGQTAVAIANARAFDAARRGREQLAAILTSTGYPVLVIDGKEAIMLLNPAAERAFGVSGQTVIGKSVGDVLNAAPLVDLLVGEGQEGVEWQNEAGQTYAPLVSDMSNDLGERTGRVLILRDITRYKNLRDNQSEFVSTVSHDLRSPLTYMHGYATMLPMVGTLNDKQKGFADKIIAGIAQMTDLVDKILDASRLDPEGNYELNREACDVAKVVTEIASGHQQPAEKKNLKLDVAVDDTIPILNLDDVMVRRALNNLVDNAIKYTPEHGSITVGAALRDNSLLLSVRDTGLGISEENMKHLFERFRRVRRREHQTIKGNGLGLFIVKSVAQKHGGDAWVESKEGEGSTFLIRIPLEGANLVGAESHA